MHRIKREEFDKVMDDVFSNIQLINSMDKEDKDANNQSPSAISKNLSMLLYGDNGSG
jgi:hypothetical protein